ncbi:glycosyl hydrolase family 95 catalytic domain-containing protein [Bacillus sp. SD088]|uniref:glycosyl hydrolase family 95 catalytic domain-containing protein n=1 Tax=Bacillus sp. SD088 TaxID=2782012 RepID=UPI001A95A0AC|nr:glycoside hydrolase N-terminal domain-containing protein [Bacillus sp. SD088]MBO0995336.1 glycoside hydrolase N-terminal domain-containing protein [Bacillus sp. SD088]
MNESKNNQYKLKLSYPASWWRNMWREALPSGNGKIGAAVYGGIKDETILINHEELWHLGKKDEVPDVSHTLAETRRLMSQKDHMAASWNLTNALKEKGYNTRLASRLPLGALKVTMPCEYAFKNYSRVLNMETGEVSVKWEDGQKRYERKVFVSRADDLIAYEITSNYASIQAEVYLALQKSEGRKLIDRVPLLVESVEGKPKAPYYYYAAKNEDGTDFGGVFRVIPVNGQMKENKESIQFTNAEKILILVKIFVKGERKKEWQRLTNELADIDHNYEELLNRHTEIHRPLFHSAEIELTDGDDLRSNEELLLEAYSGEAPTSLIEKMWAYGRYLFISGTRAEGQPFGLYGLWFGDYRLMWGHNMANENIQMMYWHANVGGFIELVPALFNYYDQMMDDFRKNARQLYGCRGIFIPAGTTPGIGVPNQVVPVIMNWTGAAGWLAKHFYDYFLFSNDHNFLKEKVLPFMREAALFYEDFLVLGDDGFYKIYPSVSPENTPENHMPKNGQPLAHPMPTTINATVDFAIIKELLAHLIEGSRIAGEEESNRIAQWKDMLVKIPDYQINEDGAIREWMHPDFDDRYDHRHLSHIYPIFPGQEFTCEDNPSLFKAFEAAVRKRLIGAQTGWSLAHMSSIYARIGAGDQALECLNIIAQSCLVNNFFTLHNDWRDMGISMNSQTAPVQLDANLGWINAVQEMLIYISPTLVKLLPALPTKWKQGKVRDFCFTTGKISFSWDIEANVFSSKIVAERDTNVKVILPGFCEYDFHHFHANTRVIGANSLEIKINKGEVLTLQSR